MSIHWRGVMPAITTPFHEDLTINHEFLAEHCRWLVANGCTGVVALGSLGEGGTLLPKEKSDVLRTCVQALGESAPVVAGIAALSTSEAVSIAKEAAAVGCGGLMVLPPYVYLGDWHEIKTHVGAVFDATDLPCMLYNNPIAYGVDFLAHQVAELAANHPNLRAVKESSADVRRVMALRTLVDEERLNILVGVDDAIVESIPMGASGWIAGLVNAFPAESVRLFNLAVNGEMEKSLDLYRWFLPLLRMDTVPKFVQLIKLAQEEVGMGSSRVRPPRLPLHGAELDEARAVIGEALRHRPSVSLMQSGAAQ